MPNLPKICFLVDDDQDDQEIFTMALREIDLPVQCVIANDCSEAISKLRKDTTFHPDYIFLDINMPKMNGKECLREIKKEAHLQHIPVVMYSTSLKPSDIIETRKLGAIGFITKPNKVSDLAVVLSNFFQSPKTSVILD
jgi:CheY-like chemotaxis protein